MTKNQAIKEALHWLKIACFNNDTIVNDANVGKAIYLLEHAVTLHD